MPSNLYRSPEELHRVYVSNTEAFYSVAGREHAAKLDDFVESRSPGFENSPSITKHVDSINVLFKGRNPNPNCFGTHEEQIKRFCLLCFSGRLQK